MNLLMWRKSFTTGKGGQGIKFLKKDKYELKILGDNGNFRLYGKEAENGQIIFTEFKRQH